MRSIIIQPGAMLLQAVVEDSFVWCDFEFYKIKIIIVIQEIIHFMELRRIPSMGSGTVKESQAHHCIPTPLGILSSRWKPFSVLATSSPSACLLSELEIFVSSMNAPACKCFQSVWIALGDVVLWSVRN